MEYIICLHNILSIWTKYAKSGFYIETKQGSEEGDLNAQATLISRQATSLALKCSSSKELLDKIQNAMHDLNSEADTYLSERHYEKSNEISLTPNECVLDPINGVISFRILPVIKGPKETRFKNVLEKILGKKWKKAAQKEGSDHSDSFCSSVKFILIIYFSYLLHSR
jgi:hypothetical protein